MVGVHDARGFDSAQGGQMESWLDYGNGDFTPNPKYPKLSKLTALPVQHERSAARDRRSS